MDTYCTLKFFMANWRDVTIKLGTHSAFDAVDFRWEQETVRVAGVVQINKDPGKIEGIRTYTVPERG